MTIGEKIKSLRKKENLSQEAFAEKLNVSRSAVAKWESDNGVPDIGNLKMISEFFSVSIDALLNDTKTTEEKHSKDEVVNALPNYLDEYRDIELVGWNDNVLSVLIFAEDEDFYYYQYLHNDKIIFGLVSKKYIQSITPSKNSAPATFKELAIERNYFCGKPVLIERAHRKYIIPGFFDFRNDDYQNVRIQSFRNSELQLEFGETIPIDDICKIEELSD